MRSYLATREGRTTPDDVAWRLMALPDPGSLGMGAQPSREQLHQTRHALEDLCYLEAAHEATDGELPADETGLYRRALLRLRGV